MARSATTGPPNPDWPTCSTSSPGQPTGRPRRWRPATPATATSRRMWQRPSTLLRPVRQRRAALEADLAYVDAVLAEGADDAHGIAALTYARASDAIGLLSPSPPD